MPLVDNSPTRPRLFRAESITQSLGLYLPTMFVYRGLGLLRGLVLAWLLHENEYGLLQVSLLAINFLTPLCGLGLYDGLARYVPQYETRHALRAYLRRVIPPVVLLTAVLCAAVALAAAPLGGFLFATLDASGNAVRSAAGRVELTRLAAAIIFAVVLFMVLLAVLKGLRMFRAFSAVELVNNIAFTGVVVGVALAGWRSVDAVLVCYGGMLVIVIVTFAPALWRVIRASPAQREPLTPAADTRRGVAFEQLLRFSVWAGLAAIMWQALQSYPMWYLQKVHGPQETAVFGGVRQIAQGVIVVTMAIVAVVTTTVNKTWEASGPAEADRKLALAFKTTGLLLVTGCVVLAAGSRWIIRLLPAGYAPGAEIMPLALLFFLLCGHLMFLAIHFGLIEKSRHLFWPWAVGVAANVVFAMRLIRPGQEMAEALWASATAGVLAAAAALAVTLALLRLERRPVDAGTYLVVVASFALVLPVPWAVLIVTGLLLLTAATGVVLTLEQKAEIAVHLASARDWITRARRR